MVYCLGVTNEKPAATAAPDAAVLKPVFRYEGMDVWVQSADDGRVLAVAFYSERDGRYSVSGPTGPVVRTSVRREAVDELDRLVGM